MLKIAEIYQILEVHGFSIRWRWSVAVDEFVVDDLEGIFLTQLSRVQKVHGDDGKSITESQICILFIRMT